MIKSLVNEIQTIKELQSVGINRCPNLANITPDDITFLSSHADKLRNLGADYAFLVLTNPEYREMLMSLDLSYKSRTLLCNNPDLIKCGEEYLREYLSLVSGDTVEKLKKFSLKFVKNFMTLFNRVNDYDEAEKILDSLDELKASEIKAIESIGDYVQIKSCDDFKTILKSCNATKLKHLTELLKNVPQNMRLPHNLLIAENKDLSVIAKFVAGLDDANKIKYVTNFLHKNIKEQLEFVSQYVSLKKQDTNFECSLDYEIDFYNVRRGNIYSDLVIKCHNYTLSKEVDSFIAFLMQADDKDVINHVIENMSSITNLKYNNLVLNPECFESKIDFSNSAIRDLILSDTINNTSTNYRFLETKVTLEELRFIQENTMNYTILCNNLQAGVNRLKILQSVSYLNALEGIQLPEELATVGAALTAPLPQLRAEWGLEFINYNKLLKGIGKVGLEKMLQLTTKYLADTALANLADFKEVNSIRELLVVLNINNQAKIDDIIAFYKMPEYYKTRYKDNLDSLAENGCLDILHRMMSWNLGKSRARARNDLAYNLVKGKFLDYKYNSLDRELATTLSDSQKAHWRTNYNFTLGDYIYEESDSVVDMLTYFDGNLNYRDGSNKDLCFCLLDGCKKVWIVKKDNKVVLKAFVRLTKIDLSSEPAYISKNTEQRDYLSIFIEDCNNMQLTKSETDVVLGNIQNALLKKASDMQAQLISTIKLISKLSSSSIVQCSVFSGLTFIDKLYDVSSGRVLKPMNDGIYCIKNVNKISV